MFILPPRSSWLYRMSMSLSPTRRYLVTFFFMTVCTCIWFHYIYWPLTNRIDALEQQHAALSRTASAENIVEAIAALRDEVSTQSSSLSSDDQINTVLSSLDHAGMVLENCSVQDKALYVQAAGTYNQCLAFFDHLAVSPHHILPRDVRITRGIDNLFSLSLVVAAS